MNKNISKYIDSNREINSNLYELNPYKKILTKKTYGTNVTLVEDDIFYRKDKTQKNEIQNDQNYHELNLNESLSDDDIQVIHQFNEEEDQQSSNKRKRLDSDEEVDDKTSVKDELDELIKDEDGDIMIDQAKVIFELNQNKKTVYRDEKGNRVERSNLKKEKRKELEQKNNENVSYTILIR